MLVFQAQNDHDDDDAANCRVCCLCCRLT